MDWDKLQSEHAEWLQRKYPHQPCWLPAYGLVEESSELLHTVVKRSQIERWGEDERYVDADLRLKFVDDLGDCSIYCISLCNAMGWRMAEIVAVAGSPKADRTGLLIEAINLVRLATQVAEHPSKHMLIAFFAQLNVVADHMAENVGEATATTWQVVKER